MYVRALNSNGTKKKRTSDRVAQRKKFLDAAVDASPSFKQAYLDVVDNHNRLKRVKRFFNGATISALTGLYGKDLGYCMRHIRETFGSNHEFETFFELATEEEAAAVIRERAGILSTDKQKHPLVYTKTTQTSKKQKLFHSVIVAPGTHHVLCPRG